MFYLYSALQEWAAPKLRAFNASSAVESQKIRSVEFEAPVVFADVLHYDEGELGPGSEAEDIYYTPEALQDREYLETILRSPVSVGTHDKNTSEWNRDVDGWIREAWWDDQKKAVMAKGVVYGADNVAYVEKNRGYAGFGTSGAIDFRKQIKREPGRAPNGKSYTAFTTKLTNNHLAILPNIRDKKNVILALNAKLSQDAPDDPGTVNPVNADTEQKGETKMAEEKKAGIDPDELKNAVEDLKKKEADNAEYEGMKNTINEMKAFMSEFKNAKNAEAPAEEKKEEKPENAKNEEEVANSDDMEFAQNALPSQELVKDISEGLGVTFVKTPTIRQLAKATGVSATAFPDVMAALNAKRQEYTKGSKPVANAENATEPQAISSYNSLLSAM